MRKDPEHMAVVGTTGGGKTTILNALLKKSKRTITMTTKAGDFTENDGWVQVASYPELVAQLKKRWNYATGFRICFRVAVSPKDVKAPIKALDDVSNLLWNVMRPYEEGRDHRQIGLVVDEAHRFFPADRPKGMDAFEWVVSEGRASGISLIMSTQRPVNIPTICRGNITHWFVLLLGDNRSVATVKEFVGSKNFELVPKYQYALYTAGTFVIQGSTRSPKIPHQLP